MSNTNTGGPAFPRTGRVNGVGLLVERAQNGMTLRDYFAAKAMQANIEMLSAASLPDWNAEVARLSYLMADAMLKARKA